MLKDERRKVGRRPLIDVASIRNKLDAYNLGTAKGDVEMLLSALGSPTEKAGNCQKLTGP